MTQIEEIWQELLDKDDGRSSLSIGCRFPLLAMTARRRAAIMADNPISTAARQECECCTKFKMCRMYVLQDGHAAWVCTECRTGSAVAGKKRDT